jgi:predicted 3-demethylubiquinone-9 3-methyltransferase (glyoxalase superfamily)
MPPIVPCLWFDTQAEEAANFYTSVFPSSRILGVSHNGKGMHRPEGMVLTVDFELDGQRYVALNGGPEFPFTQAISLTIYCKTQDEIDSYWSKLVEGGGSEVMCGWLKDRYGLSWQVVPESIPRMLTHGSPAARDRVMQAVMGMVKLDLAALERAFEGT